MTRMKALLAGSALAAVTALSVVGMNAASADDAKESSRHGYYKAHSGDHGWGRHHSRGRHGGFCGKHAGGRMERHIGLIEGLMDFTPEQQTAWNELKTAMASGRETIEKSCEARKDDDKAKKAVDRLDRVEEAMSERLAVLRAVKPAFEKFYGTLSEKQQKAVDDMFTHRGRRG